MGLQHVGQANANQPYNSGEQNRPRKSTTTEWRFLTVTASPLCLSVSLSSWAFHHLDVRLVCPVGRSYSLSSLLPRRQTWRLQGVNVLQWGCQVVTKEFQTPPLHQTWGWGQPSSVSDLHWDRRLRLNTNVFTRLVQRKIIFLIIIPLWVAENLRISWRFNPKLNKSL